MDVAIVAKKALLGGVVEVGAVVDGCDFRRGTAEDLGAPWASLYQYTCVLHKTRKERRHTSIKMRVKVNDAHGAISTVDRPQQRQSDGMVTAKGDDTGQGLAILSRTLLLGVRHGLAGEDAVVTLLDLVEGIGVVV
jgi:hypothetical protein